MILKKSLILLLDQDDKEEHDGHNNGQTSLNGKVFNFTELKKSKVIMSWHWSRLWGMG